MTLAIAQTSMTRRTSCLRIYHLVRQSRPTLLTHRYLTTSTVRRAPDSLPSIPTCPPSSCACAIMPEGLNIDHNRNLNGTMPPYAQHVIIRTGRDDWSSRIEDDPSSLGTHVGANLGGRTLAHTLKGGSNLARTLKGLVGPGGKFHDVSEFHRLLGRSRVEG